MASFMGWSVEGVSSGTARGISTSIIEKIEMAVTVAMFTIPPRIVMDVCQCYQGRVFMGSVLKSDTATLVKGAVIIFIHLRHATGLAQQLEFTVSA